MSTFNVYVDETASIVTVNEDTQSIVVQHVGVQGPQGSAGSGAENFTELDDAPSSYAGSSLKFVRVKADESGLEFTSSSGSGVTDHGDLTGLSDDDHTQYHNDTRGDVRYYTKTLSDAAYEPKNSNIQSHISNTSNPHSTTATQVGLGNVDNTSDLNKPISTATQTALDTKVDENAPITGATKTKITYDTKGLVTSGADATTADIADSSNKRYVTDAQLTVIGNTSGTNTGDQDLSSYATTAASQSYSDGKVSDTAYNATSWDGVTGIAPSKNAVRDQTETMLTSIAAKMPLVGGIFTGAVIESVVTLADAATIAVDATLGNIFTVTLAGNRTLGNPTGAVNGQKFIFRIRQDGTGSRTLAYDTKFRFGTDVTSPTLTTTAAKTDYIGVIYHSADDKFDVLAVVKGL